MNKLLSMMGLCKKAGRLLEGYEVVVEGVARGKVYLVLTTEDLSPRTLRRVKLAVEQAKVEHISLTTTMQEIQERLGKRVGILGVADKGFAKAIIDRMAT